MKKQFRRFTAGIGNGLRKTGRGFKWVGKMALNLVRGVVGGVVIAAGTVVAVLGLIVGIPELVLNIIRRSVRWIAVAIVALGLILWPSSTSKTEPVNTGQVVADGPLFSAVDDDFFNRASNNKTQYELALAQKRYGDASYYFGRMQAEHALVSDMSLDRAWGLVAKEVKAHDSGFHMKDVKRGWDEELSQHPVAV